MERLLDWCERHRGFEERLAQLRRIVPERDLQRTATVLSALDAELRLHMEQEERVLLPAYAPLARALPPNAAPGVFEADHHRIRALLDALAAPATDAAGVLAQQRALSLLSGVLEHHDLRERRWLKAVLDEAIPAATRLRWLEGFLEEERRLLAEPRRAADPGLLGCRAAPAPTLYGGTPTQRIWLAVAQDAPLARPWAAVPVPDHPRGARLHARCGALVAQILRTQELVLRRDRLARLADQLRLLELIGEPPPRAVGRASQGERGV